MKNCRFGYVESYDPTGRLGWMRISGEPQKVHFWLNAQRPIVPGFSEPEFGEEPRFVVPQRGERVVVELKVDYITLVNTRTNRCLSRRVEAVRWGYTSSFEEATRTIAGRPVYEVVEFTLYKGEPVSNPEAQRRVVATGTAIRLQESYPRGEGNDLLAPERKVMDFIYRRRFYLRSAEGKAEQCPDPRPMPTGATPEEFRPVNGQGVPILAPSELWLSAPDGKGWKQESRRELAAV